MAQDGTTAGGASYTLDNVTFPVGRNKLQSIFDAIRSTNIGNTAPDLVAGQFWIDNNTPSTTVWTLYLYDGTDSIQFATIDTINNTVNFIDSAFDLIVDTTPQLGGNLDLNSNDITGTGNINITGTATVTGLTTTGDINFGDNDKANFGASNDLQIYHDGLRSLIRDQGTGNLMITADNFEVNNANNTANKITAITGGAVNLFYNNSKKFETTSTGIDVTGTITFDGGTTSADLNFGDNDKAQFGASNDLQIYSDGVSNDYIDSTTSNVLQIRGSDVRLGKYTGETFVRGAADGAVTIYYDNAIKLATTSTGIEVTGTVNTDLLDVVGNNSGGVFAQIRNSDPTQTGGAILDFKYGNTLTGRIQNRFDGGSFRTDIWGGVNGLRIFGDELKTQERIMANSGSVVINETSDDVDFRVESNNNTHALFVDGGNDAVTIGKSAVNNTTAGITMYSGSGTTGSMSVVRDGGSSLILNRLTSDGDITELRKDGTTVGAISALLGDMVIGTGDVAIRFADGFDAIIPMNINLSERDNGIDIGLSTARFNDAHFGGTVNAQLGVFGTDTGAVAYANTGVTVDDGTATGRYGFTHFGATDRYVRMGIPNSSFAYFETNTVAGFNFNSGAIFNENSLDRDFRVESNNSTHMLYVDGGSDEVGIGTNSPSSTLDVAGIGTFKPSGTTSVKLLNLALNSGSSSGTTGLYLGDASSGINVLTREKTSINTASVVIYGENGFGVAQERLKLNPSSAVLSTGGTERMSWTNSEATINDQSNDYDFRVESNNNSQMIFVDGANDNLKTGGLHIHDTDAEGTLASHQTITGEVTAPASGTTIELVQVGHTNICNVSIIAKQTASSVGVAHRTVCASYGLGNGGTVTEQYNGGNVTDIDIFYQNGGTTAYTINATITYTGTAPTIHFTVDGKGDRTFLKLV